MATDTRGATEIQRLSAGDLKPLADLIDHLALASHFPGDAVLYGADPVIRSPHHLGEASAMVNLLIGIAGGPSGMRARVSRPISKSTSLTRCTIYILHTIFTSRASPSVLVLNLST